MTRLLDGLNPEQKAAVEHGSGPLLVLAGAGSGKTRVITHRIARLLERGVRPWNVLAVTFTNKAAGEMLERLRKLAGAAAEDVWVSTFHAAGVRILRRDGARIGLPRNFTIFDTADQLALMKRVVEDLRIPDRVLTAKDALGFIDGWKNAGLLPHEVKPYDDNPAEKEALRAYKRYTDAMAAQGAVDFGDLLLRVVELLRSSPETREAYQRRFVHLLVDEFQDTNPVQYELLRLLCPDDKAQANLCVVGDDDQSIYGWRGAEVRNILRFPEDFPGAQVVKLERNYRSTPNILEAAHAVISKNRERAPKKLWTDGEAGDKLSLVVAHNDRDEASRVAERIGQELARGTSLGEMAVFYRSNAQSRLLEEGLRTRSIPYAVVRGQSFYDRAEIKDVAAWLRLVTNPNADEALLRAVQSPPRGIGDTTLEKLRAHANQHELSLFAALADAAQIPGLNAAAQKRLAGFRALLEELGRLATSERAGDVAEAVLHKSGLLERLAIDPRGENVERQENVQEFVRAVREFDLAWAHVKGQGAAPGATIARPDMAELVPVGPAQLAALKALLGDSDEQPPSALEAFLMQLAVIGDADTETGAERVSLMTLHAAKGLEFDVVFVTGLEEGVFPSSRSLNDEDAISEERRLCYVGITRARRRVNLTLARQRALYGDLRMNPPSRFLSEVPADLVDGGYQLSSRPVQPRWSDDFHDEAPTSRAPFGAPRRPVPSGTYVERDEYVQDYEAPPPRRAPTPRPSAKGGAAFGRKVRHKVFGVGKVLGCQGSGESAKYTVDFPGVGAKVVIGRFLEADD